MSTNAALRVGCLLGLALLSLRVHAAEPPNVVIILCDDLGYGDLSCQGHPLIRTPHIDRLAREGQRWTSFYASAPLCNPSRVAMLTGRMPIRIHGSGLNRWRDLPRSEVTIAELLEEKDYATCYVGKWGVSDFEKTGAHPEDQGFDHYFGLVGSNDAPVRKNFRRTQMKDEAVPGSCFPQDSVRPSFYPPFESGRFARIGGRRNELGSGSSSRNNFPKGGSRVGVRSGSRRAVQCLSRTENAPAAVRTNAS